MREIDVELSRVRGENDAYYNTCVSSGIAYLLLRANHQRHLDRAARVCIDA